MNDRLKLISLCVERLGYRRGVRVAEFIGEWELCVRSTGGLVGAEEFAAWWEASASTAYRRLVEFRAAFPELGPHGVPSALMRPLLERLEQGRDVSDFPPVGLPVGP